MQKPSYATSRPVVSKLALKPDPREEVRAWRLWGLAFCAVCGLKMITLWM